MNSTNISSRELILKNQIPLNTKAKNFSNQKFWHYTSLNTINLILKNHCIHISNLNEMNDIEERDLHGTDCKFIHAFCLCNSNTEKIPMWYLYSGIAGNGAAIGFTPAVLLKYISSIKYLTDMDRNVTLYLHQDFDIEYGWVFYRKHDNNSDIKYKGKWFKLTDPEKFEEKNYFIKSFPWEYECEFRILFKNKTGISYNKLVLELPEEFYSKLRIKLAPEISKSDFINLSHELDGFHNFLFHNLFHSDLSINMELFEKNYDSFFNYIKAEIQKERIDSRYKGLYDIISKIDKNKFDQ